MTVRAFVTYYIRTRLEFHGKYCYVLSLVTAVGVDSVKGKAKVIPVL